MIVLINKNKPTVLYDTSVKLVRDSHVTTWQTYKSKDV